MADVNKPKLQLRSGLSLNGGADKTPSPATKLLISHGKPNFTIQKGGTRMQNGNASPVTPPLKVEFNNNNNSDEFVVKSTTFNGVFKPSNISAATKQSLPSNGLNGNTNGNDNEAAKVVLRRTNTKVGQTEVRESEEDANVPEFIRRQRRIQERLANQNILDFENRRSGYFTHVVISPSSPNRQSFVETMASPAVKPGLEIPPPASPTLQEDIKEETSAHLGQEEHSAISLNEPITLDGHVEEEEVAKAIEEVNKAVAGEDDDKTEVEDHSDTFAKDNEPVKKDCEIMGITLEQLETFKPEIQEEPQQEYQSPVVAVVTSAILEEETPKEETPKIEQPKVEAPKVEAPKEEAPKEEAPKVEASKVEAPKEETPKEETFKVETPKDVTPAPVEALVSSAPVAIQQNGHVEAVVTLSAESSNTKEEPQQNGHSSNGQASDAEITISHTNGSANPSIPSPDPSGEKGVNFETKTVVSFSQELGNGVNKYPETVKIVKESETSEVDSELKELTKLKFEINGDNENIEVKPVLVTETI